MCFTQISSLAFSFVGFSMALYSLIKLKNTMLFAGVFYFSLMELLQFFQHFWIDECSSSINRGLTVVGYLHVCFQPLFTNILCMSTTKNPQVRSVFSTCLKLSFIAGILLSMKWLLYSASDDYSFRNNSNEWLVGDETCTYSGKYHLAWSVMLKSPSYYVPSVFLHNFMMFTPFLLAAIHDWSFAVNGVFLFVTGPLLASYITSNLHEAASIWCFTSVTQLAVLGLPVIIKSRASECKKIM